MINYFKNTVGIIEDSLKSINENDFKLLVEHSNSVLNSGGKIVVTGLGKNVPICEKFVGAMNSLGMNAAFLHTNSAVHGDLGVVKKEDLVILLSKSGNTSESVYLSSFLKEIACETWILSFNKECLLKDVVDHSIIIQLEHEGDRWNIVPNNSSTINLIVLQALAMQLLEKRNIQIDVFKRNHPGGHIGELLKKES